MLHSSQGLQFCSSRLHNAWRCLCLSSADSHMLQSPLYLALRLVTYCNTVFASDTSLAVAFGSPLSYFTYLKYTVQSSHSLVRCPQSSTFCVDPSSACDASSSSSGSSPSSPSHPSTSLVPRSNLLCPQSSTFCIDPSSACDASSSSFASASSPSLPSYTST